MLALHVSAPQNRFLAALCRCGKQRRRKPPNPAVVRRYVLWPQIASPISAR